MGNTETASTLVLVAAILQILFSLFNMTIGFLPFLMFMPFMMDPLMWGFMGIFMIGSIIVNLVFGIIGLVFAISWLNWRAIPGEHKTGLIITGIVALLVAGFIPGLLALIAGAIVSSTPEYPVYEMTKSAPTRSMKRCPSCGEESIGDDDQFCWRCGSRL